MEHILEPLLAMLEAYEFDVDFYKQITSAKREHQEFMCEMIHTLPEIDINYVKFKTDNENILAIYKETL